MKSKLFAVVVLLFLLVTAAPAYAHQEVHINGYGIEIGWGSEPAIVGEPNSAEITVHGPDERPVTGLRLQVEIGFGDQVMDRKSLEPAFDEPGRYEADVIPTQPGTYTFRLTGRLGGKPVDRTFTSGPNTFSEVEPAGELQFPDKNQPTAGDLGARADRVDTRVQVLEAAARSARDDAKQATTIAWIAFAAGVIGISVGLFGMKRKAA